MLVLTRKLMEKLYIGEDICVTVVRLEGGQVRLGIDAPRHVAIVRGELLAGEPPGARIEPRRFASHPELEPDLPVQGEPTNPAVGGGEGTTTRRRVRRSRTAVRGTGSPRPGPSR